MTDEQIDALKQAVESVLEYADYWQPYAPSVIDDARAILALVDAQAAEIATLKALVQGWHYLAVGPDEMGDYHTQKALIKASEPYAHPALKALTKETQP